VGSLQQEIGFVSHTFTIDNYFFITVLEAAKVITLEIIVLTLHVFEFVDL
jgi:hypothetical protein